MNLDTRRDKIVEILNQEGRVTVSALSKKFQISSVTIRMDLEELEKMGLCSRVHGGAISSYKPYYNMNLSQRSAANEAEKKVIAAHIATLVHDSDTIMMNAGSTTLFVLRMLSRHKDLKIVTNSVAIALEAAGNPDFHVVLLGGNVNTKYQFTYGDDALRQLSEYRVDKLILSVDGIDASSGLSTYYEQEAEICRSMIEHSALQIVVADFSKFDRVAFSHIAPLSAVSDIVTNAKIPKETVSKLKKAKPNLILVD